MTLPHSWVGPEDGRVLVLSNSLGTRPSMWDRMLPWVADRFRVLRYDLPGHHGPSEPFGFDDMVGATIELLDELPVRDAVVAGVSVGGAIAVAVGTERPDLAAAVVSINAPIRQSSREFWTERAAQVERDGLEGLAAGLRARWFPSGGLEGEPVLAAFLELDPNGYAAACRALADLDVADRAARLGVPALVVAALDDASVPPSNAIELVERIRDGVHWPVAVGGHLLPVRRPALVGGLLSAFAESRLE